MKNVYLLLCAFLSTLAVYAQEGNLVLSTPLVDVEYQITGMSPNGKWACGTINDGNYRGFLWNLTTGEVRETSAPGDISIALGVDDHGVIVGSFTTSTHTPNNIPLETFGYYKNGRWTELALTNEKTGVSIERDGYANAISRDGRTIGGIAKYKSDYVPVVWIDGELNIVENATGAIYDVSSDGKTVCGWTLHPKKNNRTCAIWTTQKSLYDTKIYTDTISAYSAGPFCVARKISPNGRYVAAYDRIYDMTNGSSVAIDLDEAYGGFEFYGVTNTGKIYGYYHSGKGGPDAVWFGWDGKMTKLSDHLVKNNVDISNYKSLFMLTNVSEDEKSFGAIAYDINDIPRSLVIKLEMDTMTMSPVLLKARTLNGANGCYLSWKEPLRNASNVLGYHLYRDNQRINTQLLKDLYFIDQNIPLGQHTYTITANYVGNVESEKSEEIVISVEDSKPMPVRNVMALSSHYNDVRLLWDAPHSSRPSFGYTDFSDNVLGFGGGTFSFESAIKIRKEELELYRSSDYQITEISFIPLSQQSAWKVNFYVGDNMTPIYSETIPSDQLQYGIYNRFKLSQPLSIPEGQNLTMGIYVDVTGFGGYQILGTVFRPADAGYSDLLRQAGQDTFFSLYEAAQQSQGGAYEYNVCWGMNVHFSKKDVSDDWEIKEYRIFADGQALNSTKEEKFRHVDVNEGDHYYEVAAVYSNGEISEPASASIHLVGNKSVFEGIVPHLTMMGKTANVSWENPSVADKNIITFANDENTGGLVGSANHQYSYMVATKYSGDKLRAYDEFVITGFRFYPLADADFAFILKENDKEIAYVPIDRGSGYTLNKWNYVKLESPIAIHRNSQFMLILDCYDVTPECAPVGMDSQMAFPSVSDLYSTDDGLTFKSLSSQGGKNGNWMMGMVVQSKEVGLLPVEGYHVYLDDVKKHDGLYTETNISLHDLDEGSHRLKVNPHYAHGIGEVSSEIVTFVVDLTGIEELSANGISIANETDFIKVSGSGVLSLQIWTLSGKKVAENGGSILPVSHLNPGTYVLDIKTLDGHHPIKVQIQ